MGYDDITPHLNKIATLYLKGNKRKVGWIFVDRKQANSTPPAEISFISVQKGKRLLEALENRETEALEARDRGRVAEGGRRSCIAALAAHPRPCTVS